ncbi:hypothetical protein R3P38DRAFT_2517126 [Favolaschia claudopus]|uniref:CCHC-type domain-containing protein n=1 Tax=Favolaschia claudopus TaxID=2862362 RepID=A0AAW0CDR4_9AGAR
MSPSEFASVERHPNKLPTLHKGKLTPMILDEFDNACRNFFILKDTAEEKQVATIFGCFMEQHIVNMLRPTKSRERYSKMTFTAFMTELRETLLDDDWQTDLRTTVLTMRMNDDQKFDEFATSLLAHTSLLADTDDPMDDVAIRHQLVAGMTDELRYRYLQDADIKKLNATENVPVQKWVRAVNKIDEALRREIATQRRLIAEQNKENKRKQASYDSERGSKRQAKGDNKPAANGGGTGSSSKYPPKLTDDERELLRKHDGCMRCRKPYAGHYASDCENPASVDNVVIVTEKLCNDTRRAKGKAPASATATTSKTIAAIVPPVLSESEDEDSLDIGDRSTVSISSTPTSPHLFWGCLMDGPGSLLPVQVSALIDNGAHLVIIDDSLATRLSLRRFQLHEPEEISDNSIWQPGCQHVWGCQIAKFYLATLHVLIYDYLSGPL